MPLTARDQQRMPGRQSLYVIAILLLPGAAAAALDLSLATLDRLENGLTLVVLEEHSFPVVSVQMLYRVGARDEQSGRTGLAHYLEHMAFRATENFPDTEVVSSIYAVGGEWHGYTWIDQTTYFETLPSEHLDLALRIEADRMGRLLLPAGEFEAERGAVLAELHGYDGDPGAVVYDAVVQVSLLTHPYRNNTIGWESDVLSIEHADVVDFYRRHYRPANAVLAIAGDVSTSEVRARVRELFGSLPGAPATPLPRSVEPAQAGERRVRLEGAGTRSHFAIAYHAPAVRSTDFPAFLLLQELLAGTSGVNFNQDFGANAAAPEGLLYGATDDLRTWFQPSAQPYVFTISGSVSDRVREAEVEQEIERQIASLREQPVDEHRLHLARERLLHELLFDVETTEDAAHQLAFFAGLDALDVLLQLPDALARISPQAIRAIARRYLHPRQRTIAWYAGGSVPELAPVEPERELAAVAAGQARQAAYEPPSPPLAARLSNGLPVITQRVALTPSCFVRVMVPSTAIEFSRAVTRNDPVWGYTSLGSRATSARCTDAIRTARSWLEDAHPAGSAPRSVNDPDARLQDAFQALLDSGSEEQLPAAIGPALVVVVGDLDPETISGTLETAFGDTRPALSPPGRALRLREQTLRMPLPQPVAQGRLGYVVPAAAPTSPDAWPWRMLLYVLAHGYEGRLGKEAISRRGLVYYIDSQYHSDGQRAFITLTANVDPGKLGAFEALLREQLSDLRTHPPTRKEVAEAQQHLLGRSRSAAVSNEELSAALARQWLWYGRLLQAGELERSLAGVGARDLRRIVPAFVDGAVVVLEPAEP